MIVPYPKRTFFFLKSALYSVSVHLVLCMLVFAAVFWLKPFVLGVKPHKAAPLFIEMVSIRAVLPMKHVQETRNHLLPSKQVLSQVSLPKPLVSAPVAKVVDAPKQAAAQRLKMQASQQIVGGVHTMHPKAPPSLPEAFSSPRSSQGALKIRSASLSSLALSGAQFSPQKQGGKVKKLSKGQRIQSDAQDAQSQKIGLTLDAPKEVGGVVSGKESAQDLHRKNQHLSWNEQAKVQPGESSGLGGGTTKSSSQLVKSVDANKRVQEDLKSKAFETYTALEKEEEAMRIKQEEERVQKAKLLEEKHQQELRRKEEEAMRIRQEEERVQKVKLQEEKRQQELRRKEEEAIRIRQEEERVQKAKLQEEKRQQELRRKEEEAIRIKQEEERVHKAKLLEEKRQQELRRKEEEAIRIRQEEERVRKAEELQKIEKKRKAEEAERLKKLDEQRRQEAIAQKRKIEAEKIRMRQEEARLRQQAYEIAKQTAREEIEGHIRAFATLHDPELLGASAVLNITLDDQGNVVKVAIEKSSGNRRFDEVAVNTWFKASPIPLPDDPDFPELRKESRDIRFTFNLQELTEGE